MVANRTSSITTARAALGLLLLMGFLAQGAVFTPCQAQDARLSGMLDIDFGSTLAEARESMLQREGVMLDLVHSNDDNLVCDGGSFAGQDVGFWVFGFVDDQMHTAKAIIEPEKERLIATYLELLELFTTTYGEPAAQVARFVDPYEPGDGFETYAISFGKGHFAALWEFSDGDNENAISISIDKDLYIPVVFQSGALIDQALAKTQDKSITGS